MNHKYSSKEELMYDLQDHALAQNINMNNLELWDDLVREAEARYEHSNLIDMSDVIFEVTGL